MVARGEFLAFTDDDCESDAGWLRALAQRLAQTPDRIVGGRTINALRTNPYSETSQTIIDVAYAHFNRDGSDAYFFASNNLTLSPCARAAGGVRFKPDLSFYLKLLRATAAPERKWRAPQLTALLLWSQAANAVSFFYEKYQSGKGPEKFTSARS